LLLLLLLLLLLFVVVIVLLLLFCCYRLPLVAYLKSGELSNVLIKGPQGEELRAHKLVLASRSSILRRVLTDGACPPMLKLHQEDLSTGYTTITTGPTTPFAHLEQIVRYTLPISSVYLSELSRRLLICILTKLRMTLLK